LLWLLAARKKKPLRPRPLRLLLLKLRLRLPLRLLTLLLRPLLTLLLLLRKLLRLLPLPLRLPPLLLRPLRKLLRLPSTNQLWFKKAGLRAGFFSSAIDFRACSTAARTASTSQATAARWPQFPFNSVTGQWAWRA